MTGHLIHVGYPKTGSNFLRHWFESHPQLAFRDGGIAGFGSVHDMAKHRGEREPEILYRVTSSESLILPRGDVGEAFMDHDAMLRSRVGEARSAVCARLAALFPNARILVVTRGFETSILSAYSQYVRTGTVHTLSDLPAFVEQAAEQADYDRAIRFYRDSFGEAQVIVLPYELLRDDPAAFTAELARRLGIAAAPPPPERMNASVSPAELHWYPRMSRAVRRLPLRNRPGRRLWRLYVAALATGRLAWLARFLDRRGPRPAAAPKVDPILLDRFRGLADELLGDPLYAPYAAEYLVSAEAGPTRLARSG